MLANLITMIGAVMAMQTGPMPVPSSGKWTIDHAEISCSARRDFGSGDSRVALTIATTPTASSVLITFVAPQTGKAGRTKRSGRGTLAMGPLGPRIDVEYFGSETQTGMRQTQVHPDRMLLDDLARATSLSIEAGDSRHSVDLGNMRALVQAIEVCERNLIDALGVDAATLTPVAIPPKPKRLGGPAFWYGPNAFPEDAFKQGARGLAVAVLSIDASGKISACRVLRSSGQASLDQATCTPLMGHSATFLPAKNAAGDAIASVQLLPVYWTGPEGNHSIRTTGPLDIVIASR